MQCERKINKETCGGVGTPVLSASGEIEWGWECQKCRKFSEKCQSCGRIMRNLESHIKQSPKCADANQAHRTIAAANKIWARNL